MLIIICPNNEPYKHIFTFCVVPFGNNIRSLVVIISYLLRANDIANALKDRKSPTAKRNRETTTYRNSNDEEKMAISPDTAREHIPHRDEFG
tara:strand:- start:5136 stop:5411 length:276 start_codon:yes stop_codon:yes gene_type:complete